MTNYATAFSPDYIASRARFRSSALAAGWKLSTYGIDQKSPSGESLSIDVAISGAIQPTSTLVVSSGLHGVEGFFGAAVQAALLEERFQHWVAPDGVRVVFIHALNPFGFSWLRRTNENNVDLNRNFLLRAERYEGSPAKYTLLNHLLNPSKRPFPLEPFYLNTLLAIARYGYSALKDAVAGGQYDVAHGLFYGGERPSKSKNILNDQLEEWIGPSKRVLQLDFHTGLGPWGSYKLLLDRPANHPRTQELAAAFGAENLQAWDKDGVSYTIKGGMGAWCQQRFADRNYDVLVAEFGTYAALKVLKALRLENCGHHSVDPSEAWVWDAKQKLKETFAPANGAWRHNVVAQGMQLVDAGLSSLSLAPDS